MRSLEADSENNMQMKTSLIAVMGSTGTGKSTFINAASGGQLIVGKSLRSCTDKIGLSPPFILQDRHVTLIDTPGFDDTTKSDTEILKLISAFLSETYKAGQQLNGVIYMHRITDVRMGGIAARNFRMFRQLCGEQTLKNVVIVTNRWEEVQVDVGEEREQELMTDERLFKPVIDKGAQMVRHNNTPEMARAILSHLIQNKPIPLRIQVELVDEMKSFDQTDASAELNEELEELIRKHKKELDQLRHEFTAAMAARDKQAQEELEATRRELEAAVSNTKEQLSALSKGLNAHINRLQLDLEEEKRQAKLQIDQLEEQLRKFQGSSSAFGVNSEVLRGLEEKLEGFHRRYEELEAALNKRSRCIIM